MSSPFKLFLPDYDDTVKRTGPLYASRWGEMYAGYGKSLGEKIWFDMNFRNQLPGDYLADLVGEPRSRFVEYEREVRAEIQQLPLIDGVAEGIDKAKRLGIRVVLWTQSPREWVLETCRQSDLEDFDGFIFNARKATANSVHRGAVDAGCQLSQVVGVDDGTAGLRALTSAGATAFQYQASDAPRIHMRGVDSVGSLADIDFQSRGINLPTGSQLESVR